ncbi:MAG: monomeric [FeFe] hydrogenase [Anaerotignum sp.]
MKQFESNVQYIKYLVNKEVAEHFFQGKMEKGEVLCREIAEKIIPGPKVLFRCCIYKERHIIEERVQLLLNSSEEEHTIRVLDVACDECPIDRFVVTEACRGCLGHKCQEVCPRNAVSIVDRRAYINQNLCIECGLCKKACPFNAISEVMRPCVRSCAVGAVKINEGRKAVIDQDQCVSCGACVYQCPFGAIVDKSFILDTLDLLNNSWNNTNYHVYAVVAPAVASQCSMVKVGQVFAGIKELGFYDVVEVAVGADMVTLTEIENREEYIDKKGWEAASCCPAFVKYIQKKYPQLMDHVSTVVSPMVAIARSIREKDAKAKVVFIGSCTANKMEVMQEDIRDAVDYALTFEELQALLDAKKIELNNLVEIDAGHPSSCGRIYGRKGGISESIGQLAKQKNQQEPRSVLCEGMDECMKALKIASTGRLQGDFLEGMACKGGCIGGMASLNHDKNGVDRINAFSGTSLTDDPHIGIRNFPMENIRMNRIY